MIGKQIKLLRNMNNYTQADLAKKLNLTPKAISFYENNQRMPSTETLYKISEIFDVSFDFLYGNDEYESPYQKDHITINIYNKIPEGIPIEDIKDVEEKLDISSRKYDRNKYYFAMKAPDNSMYPQFIENDTLIIEKSNEYKSGMFVAVHINRGDAIIRTFIKNKEGTITLKPLNPEYSSITYKSINESIRIFGIVKEMRRKI